MIRCEIEITCYCYSTAGGRLAGGQIARSQWLILTAPGAPGVSPGHPGSIYNVVMYNIVALGIGATVSA